MPQNRKEFGEWLSCVGERAAVLAMVHGEKHKQVVSNVLKYAAPRRVDKTWRGKMLGALGEGTKKGGIQFSCISSRLILNGAKYSSQRIKKIKAGGHVYDQPENDGDFSTLKEAGGDKRYVGTKVCARPVKNSSARVRRRVHAMGGPRYLGRR